MDNHDNIHLHPVEKAGALESGFRRITQNPKRILKKYVGRGMTVLDLGCGTGFFTTEMAKLVGTQGKVIAVDLQEGMLEFLKQKIENEDYRKQIEIVHGTKYNIEVSEKVDFILAFYSFHEMDRMDSIIAGLKEIVKPETKILIAEQKGHVSKAKFNLIVDKMAENGFAVCGKPKIFLSRSVLMGAKQHRTIDQ